MTIDRLIPLIQIFKPKLHYLITHLIIYFITILKKIFLIISYIIYLYMNNKMSCLLMLIDTQLVMHIKNHIIKSILCNCIKLTNN